MSGTQCPCQECGTAYTARKADQRFCSTACCKVFNNRRMRRGALLYDLFMALRYERKAAYAMGVWKAACRLAEGWRDEDIAERAGRFSWGDWREFAAFRLDLFAAVRLGRDMIGRR